MNRNLISFLTLFLPIFACNQSKQESFEQNRFPPIDSVETPISNYLRSSLLYAEQKRDILKKKIGWKNVLLYSYPYDWQSFIVYFEINPGLNAYSLEPPPGYQDEDGVEKIFYTFPPSSGNNYNLVYLYID